MRGSDDQTGAMFSYISPEARVPADHPLRAVRRMTDRALARISPRLDAVYIKFGRPSVAPEKLLRALLLQALYSIRSERQLMEQLDFNILFRWFVGLGLDDAVWSPTTFTKNRDRLLDGDIAAAFFDAVLLQAETAKLRSDEHFTVDGTLLEAWASHKSFQRKDAPPPPEGPDGGSNPTIDFKGERRGNATHQSTTDPDARLYKKAQGREARLGYLGHVVMENRTGLIVDALVTPASGTAERDASLVMMSRRPGDHRITLGADKAYDTRDHVTELRHLGVTPHVAQYPSGLRRRSAIDERTTRHPGYAISQQKRKLVEQAFGWMNTVALLRKLRHRGGARVDWIFTFTAAAYNLVRMRPLIREATA
ncbi:MAG: IS5 family transposase [Vicinamibacterales bacterium]